MATSNSIILAKEFSATQGIYINAATTGDPIMWIRYEGTTASGATLAVASGGDMAFTTDGTTADTTVNTTGSIDLSTVATTETIGKVAGLINASANWSCVILGGLYKGDGDNRISTCTEVDMSTAAAKATGYYLYEDGAVIDNVDSVYAVGGCISGFNPSNYVKAANPDSNCYSVITRVSVNDNFTTSGNVVIYTCSQTVDTKIFTLALADATTTTLGDGVSVLFRSKLGQRLVARIESVDAVPGTSGFLMVNGYTVDTSGAEYKNGFALTNVAG